MSPNRSADPAPYAATWRHADASAAAPLVAPVIPKEFSLGDASRVIRRNLGLLLLLPTLVGGATATWVIERPRTYTASASFVPQSGDATRSRLAGLAAQFGVSVGDAGSRQSPAFYGDLVTSYDLLKQLVTSRLRADSTGRTTTLIDLWHAPGRDPAQRVEWAIQRARSFTTVSRGRETGIVAFTIETPTAQSAADAAARVLALVNEFDNTSRRSQAATERVFVQERLDEARADLRRAEENLADFDRRNRQIDYSPDLTLARARLEREVTLQQQVFSSLAQGFAQSRIDAMRSSPSIVVLDHPDVPTAPVPRRLVARTLIGMLSGLVLAAFIVLAREAATTARRGSQRRARGDGAVSPEDASTPSPP